MKQGATPWSLRETETPDFLEAGICSYVQRSPMWHLTERLSFSSLNTVRKSPAPPAPMPTNLRLGLSVIGRVCNFFRRPFSDAFSLPDPVVNGPRRASEATKPWLVPKYRKIGDKGILASFSAGKPKTSDFFAQKYGCLAWKVRMFLLKSSDVFAPKQAYFARFLCCFGGFLPQNPMNPPKISALQSDRFDNTKWQNAKISAKNHSKRDTMPCQNF